MPYKIIFFLLLLPVKFLAQPVSLAEKDITGLWKGSLFNDTTQKYLPYEIAVSKENGKLTGYSYTLFDIDGKKEMGIKRIRLTIKDDQLIIDDVELISNNYSAPPPRHVRVESILHLSESDSSMQLTGKWSTNRTKEFLPLTGTLQLERATDYKPMVLFKILASLKLDNELSFIKAEHIVTDVAIIEKPLTEIKAAVATVLPVPDTTQPKSAAAILKEKAHEVEIEEPVTASLPKIAVLSPEKKAVSAIAIHSQGIKGNNASLRMVIKVAVSDKPINIITVSKNKNPLNPLINDSVAIKIKPADVANKTVNKSKAITAPLPDKNKTIVAAADNSKKEIAQPLVAQPKGDIAVPAAHKTAPVAAVKEQVKTEMKMTPAIATPTLLQKEMPAIIPAAPAGPVAAADVAVRKMKNEQSVFFESDSLVLTLYDNGEVDGDTVSVLMNGKIIFAKQGLTTQANTKTIYISRDMPDTISMVMYAENLGSIPPNTGLLVIMDGDKRYEVRFTADLQTNAAILFRRRSKDK